MVKYAELGQALFTKSLIEKSGLIGSQETLAYALAQRIATSTDGIDSEEYKNILTEVVNGISNGDLMTRLAEISKKERVDSQALIRALIELSGREYDNFTSIVRSRLQAIDALAKLYADVDFKAGKNERVLQDLLSKNPWLIDPLYSKFITSDKPEAELFARLAGELKIEKYAPLIESDRSNRRPDLTFLLGDIAKTVVVIVELKAPNIPLEREHLQQLEDYIADSEAFLRKQGKTETKVVGFLIGSRHSGDSKAQGIKQLETAIQKRPDSAQWQVWDLNELLERTRNVHRQFLEKSALIPTV